MHNIVEIKAHCSDPDRIRSILQAHNADFRGTDHQIDTYFQVPDGRLKLRQGNIENTLIFYHRADGTAPKLSEVMLYPTSNSAGLHTVLTAAIPTKVVVDKRREIYFIDHVKFHIDRVAGLGSFVEIEAIDREGRYDEPTLRQHCTYYIELLGIEASDLLATSYSDMLLAKTASA